MDSITLLVVSDPKASHLALLEQLPDSTRIVVGDNEEAFRGSAARAQVILHSFASLQAFQTAWAMAPEVRWVHSLAAGVENVLFPELVKSPVPLTNARGVFRRSLAEFVMAAALFFAKDLRRMVRSQQAGVWDAFDVEELHGKTMGIIGYGEIGRASAGLASAFGMKIVALRRRPVLSEDDANMAEVFGRDRLHQMLSLCDYVLVAAPNTPETRGMLGEPELRAMKSEAVLINVGRGPVVSETALVRALQERWIRGAALDVFDQEPLPDGHPFYRLENVLLSPHCADHTPGWVNLSMQFFIDNFQRFLSGEPLLNVVDKKAGY